MVITERNVHGDLDEVNSILHTPNTFEKGMNPIILPSVIGK